MKKTTVLAIAVVCAGVLGASSQAHADLIQNQESPKKSTDTTITIKDAEDGSGKDPLDPTDPTQQHLTLESVPATFDFTSYIKNKDYTIDGTTAENIVVFNDRTDRNWSVKATVTDNKITRVGDDKEFTVDSFVVGGNEIAATGATGIVAKAAADKTEANNTGNITTEVKTLSIGFQDVNNELKANDELKGTVTYSLYNSIDVK
ncbi:hypothetical protein ACYSNW_09565 [Enterococcus sp. LJL99]